MIRFRLIAKHVLGSCSAVDAAFGDAGFNPASGRRDARSTTTVFFAPRFWTQLAAGVGLFSAASKETYQMSSKPMTRLRRQLRRWGFDAKKTRGGHWRFEHPDLIVFVCGLGKPMDGRAIRDLPAEIRRKLKS